MAVVSSRYVSSRVLPPPVSSSSRPLAIRRPRLMITTSSTVWAISASMWLARSTVRPCSANRRRKLRSQ
ncbi:MAG: hypothetical protein ACRDGE_10085 [Candidatus Limnocylindria bacterium]